MSKFSTLGFVFLSACAPCLASPPPTFPATTFYIDAKRGWAARTDKNLKRDAGQIFILRTDDGGAHWSTLTVLPPPQHHDIGQVHQQFIDSKHGFLLALSSPAASQMQKTFYRTADGGKSWHRLFDATDIPLGAFYPRGMTFRNARQGWIAGEPRGNTPFPLLKTSDGGSTWRLQSFPIPSAFKNGYANTNPPRFFGPQRRSGTLEVQFIANSGEKRRSRTIVFHTSDSGAVWSTKVAPAKPVLSHLTGE